MQFKHQIGPDVRLTFTGKPSDRVRSALKANGFRWSPQAGCWWRNRVTGAADVIQAVRTLLDQEAGIRRPDGQCWVCDSAPGFFRHEGAATPVRCDECQAAHAAHRQAMANRTLCHDDPGYLEGGNYQ